MASRKNATKQSKPAPAPATPVEPTPAETESATPEAETSPPAESVAASPADTTASASDAEPQADGDVPPAPDADPQPPAPPASEEPAVAAKIDRQEQNPRCRCGCHHDRKIRNLPEIATPGKYDDFAYDRLERRIASCSECGCVHVITTMVAEEATAE